MHRIVAYTFFNAYDKIRQFLSSIKREAHKRKLLPFFCLTLTTTNLFSHSNCMKYYYFSQINSLQCFDTVGWAAGRASGL